MTLWIIITIEGPSGVQVEEKWLRYTSKGAFIRHYKKIFDKKDYLDVKLDYLQSNA